MYTCGVLMFIGVVVVFCAVIALKQVYQSKVNKPPPGVLILLVFGVIIFLNGALFLPHVNIYEAGLWRQAEIVRNGGCNVK